MKKIVLFAVVGLLLFGHSSVFAENFNTSDLEGSWYFFDTTVDPAAVPPVPPVYWTYGEFESDASGNIVLGDYYDLLDNKYPVTGGQMMLDKKGVMSGAATVDLGRGITATAMFPHGKLDGAKTNGALVSLMTVAGASAPSMGVGSFIKGGGTFTQADLKGEWHGQGTMINLIPPGGVTAVSGTFNIDELGNVSGSYTAADGVTTATVVPAGSELVVDGDGLVSGVVNLLIQPGAISVVSVVAHGKMDKNKRSASFVTRDFVDPTDPSTLISLTNVNVVKGGGSFAGTELSGAWYTYSLAMDYSDIADPLIYWVRGQYQTDSSGNISNGYYVGPDGKQINATGGTMSLDNTGGITGNLTIEGGEALTVNGKLDQGKTYGIFGSVDDTGWMNGMTTGVMIKDTYKFPWIIYYPGFLNHE